MRMSEAEEAEGESTDRSVDPSKLHIADGIKGNIVMDWCNFH
jgi:hypothetical protein